MRGRGFGQAINVIWLRGDSEERISLREICNEPVDLLVNEAADGSELSLSGLGLNGFSNGPNNSSDEGGRISIHGKAGFEGGLDKEDRRPCGAEGKLINGNCQGWDVVISEFVTASNQKSQSGVGFGESAFGPCGGSGPEVIIDSQSGVAIESSDAKRL